MSDKKNLNRMRVLAGLSPLVENADHDFGENPTSRKGHTVDLGHFEFQGKADLPTRLVNNQGDNPMVDADEERLEEVSITKGFRTYLQEVEDLEELKESPFFQNMRRHQLGGKSKEEAEDAALADAKTMKKNRKIKSS